MNCQTFIYYSVSSQATLLLATNTDHYWGSWLSSVLYGNFWRRATTLSGLYACILQKKMTATGSVTLAHSRSLLRPGLGLLASIDFSNGLEQVAAFFFVIQYMPFAAKISTSITQCREYLIFIASSEIFFLKVSIVINSTKLSSSARLASIVDRKWYNKIRKEKEQEKQRIKRVKEI